MSATLLAAAARAEAHDAGPVPPCGTAPHPPFAYAGDPPAIALWHMKELDRAHWRPEPCTGWSPASRSRLVVALAGSFAFTGGAAALLARAGAISAFKGGALVRDASALASSDPRSRRADFSAAELPRGASVYYWVNDVRLGSVVYRMRILARTKNRIVIGIDNAAAVRAFAIPLFGPHTLQTVEYLERVNAHRWRLYLMGRIADGANPLAPLDGDIAVRRAEALYRHLAGAPPDSAHRAGAVASRK